MVKKPFCLTDRRSSMLRICCRCTARLKLPQLRLLRSYSTNSRNRHAPSILFFGSDTFSVASLKKLHETQTTEQELFRSLEIVTREPSAQGRGLKRTKRVFVYCPSTDRPSTAPSLRRGT